MELQFFTAKEQTETNTAEFHFRFICKVFPAEPPILHGLSPHMMESPSCAAVALRNVAALCCLLFFLEKPLLETCLCLLEFCF